MRTQTNINGWIVCFCNFFQSEDPLGFSVHNFQYRNADKRKNIDGFLFDPVVRSQLGTRFETHIDLNAYFIKLNGVESESSFFNQLELAQNFVENLLTFLWFVKDNCASATVATAYWQDDARTLNLAHPHHGYFKADGTSSITIFNDNEIRSAIKIFEKINTFNKDTAKNNLGESSKGFGLNSFDYTVVYKELGRIDRALRFIKQARMTNILPIKIAFYVLALECLFSTNDGTEIKHQLGERIALYIGKDYEDRLNIYKDFSNYYSVRSKYMHGDDGGSSTPNQLINYSIKIDNLTRKIMVRIIEEDSDIFNEKDSKVLKKWFTEMLFNREIVKPIKPLYPLYKSNKLGNG